MAPSTSLSDLLLRYGDRLGLGGVAAMPSLARPVLADRAGGNDVAGFYQPWRAFPLTVFGCAESRAFRTLSPAARQRELQRLQDQGCLALLQGRDSENLGLPPDSPPCLRSEHEAGRLLDRLQSLLAPHLLPHEIEHGVLMRIFDQGLLIRGDAGAGKSRLALALLERGHALIADDAVELYCHGSGRIMGRCPEKLRNHLFVRGIGLLDVAASFAATGQNAEQTLAGVLVLDQNATRTEELAQHRWRKLLDAWLPEWSVTSADLMAQVTLAEACARRLMTRPPQRGEEEWQSQEQSKA